MNDELLSRCDTALDFFEEMNNSLFFDKAFKKVENTFFLDPKIKKRLNKKVDKVLDDW